MKEKTKKTALRVGDIVEYAIPFSDEMGFTYLITEIHHDVGRGKMVANVNMPLPPSYSFFIHEIKKAKP